VNAAGEVLKEYKLDIPTIGIAKGFMRKQDRFVFLKNETNPAPSLSKNKQKFKTEAAGVSESKANPCPEGSSDFGAGVGLLELKSIVENYKNLLLQVRDEAHRFAVSYHRDLRGRSLKVV
jgi:excinuclease UvrABC nuclease subunit